MIKKLLNWLLKPFKRPVEGPKRSQPNVMLGDMVGNVRIMTQSQLDKHTDFKVGESYQLGEMIVTLRASKEEVARIIAETDARRALKEQERWVKLRERGIEIMLMTPEELKQFQLKEWLEERKKLEDPIVRLFSRFWNRKTSSLTEREWMRKAASHEELPPTKEIVNKTVEVVETDKNKVH